MNYNIYLVEDEENLNQILKSYLEKDGFNVRPLKKLCFFSASDK